MTELRNALQQQGVLRVSEDGDDFEIDNDVLENLSTADFKEMQRTLSDAGLYVAQGHKYYADGDMGAMTRDALAMAIDQDHAKDFANAYLSQTAITDTHLNKAEITELQRMLNAGGYAGDEPLTYDGTWGRKTTEALTAYLAKNPEQVANIAPSLKTRMMRYMDAEAQQVFNPVVDVPLPRPRPEDVVVSVETIAVIPTTPAPVAEDTADTQTQPVEVKVAPVPFDRPAQFNAVAAPVLLPPLPPSTLDADRRHFVVDENGVLMENGEAVPLPWDQEVQAQSPHAGGPSLDVAMAVNAIPILDAGSVPSMDVLETEPGTFALLDEVSLPRPRPDEEIIAALRPPEPTFAQDTSKEYQGLNLLHPDLIAAAENSPRIRQGLEWTAEAAEKYGINYSILANKYWQESRFNPDAVSPKGALGVAQIMPDNAKALGVSVADLSDMKTSIFMGAKFRAPIVELHGETVSLPPYNGGGVLDYVARQKGINVADVSIENFFEIMERDRQVDIDAKKSIPDGMWRSETYEYVQFIIPEYWGEETLSQALEVNTDYILNGQDGITQQTAPIVSAYIQQEASDNNSALNAIEAALSPAAPSDLIVNRIDDQITQMQTAGIERDLAGNIVNTTIQAPAPLLNGQTTLALGEAAPTERVNIATLMNREIVVPSIMWENVQTAIADLNGSKGPVGTGPFRQAAVTEAVTAFGPQKEQDPAVTRRILRQEAAYGLN